MPCRSVYKKGKLLCMNARFFIMGRRQVVSQRLLVPSFRRFESYRPSFGYLLKSFMSFLIDFFFILECILLYFRSFLFIKDYQYDIVNDKVYHADFYAVERGQLLRTKIQIRLSGSPEACRQGAVLETGITELEVECLPRNLPERIVVNVEKLGANESIHVRDIQVPEGVKILTDSDLAVAMVKFTKEEAPAATDTDEAAATAAPADAAATSADAAAPKAKA